MRILVTGASGFLGAAITRELVLRGHRVRALVLPGDAARGLEGIDVEKIRGDVLVPELLPAAVEGCEAVVHAAGRVSLRVQGRAAMHRLNVEGSRAMAQAARLAQVRRFLQVSSIGVLGAHTAPVPVDEDHPAPGALRQKHHYHLSKIAADTAVTEALQGAVEQVTVMPTMLWGPGDGALSSTGYALQALRGETLFCPRVGGASILDVEDAARGVALALERGRTGARYCLAGANLTLEHLCGLIAGAVPKPVPVRTVALPLIATLGWVAEILGGLGVDLDFSLDIRRQSGTYWWANGAKAEQDLGFKFAITPDHAIARTVEWLQASGLVKK